MYVVSHREREDRYDSDVANEKRKIDNQYVNNNVLMMKDLYKVFHPRAGEFSHSFVSLLICLCTFFFFGHFFSTY